MKKRMMTLVTCALAAAAFSAMGCSAEDKPVTLTLYGDAGNVQRPFMQKLFELYEEKTGNKLDVQGIESENFETVCLTKFQTGDIPDLFLHHGGYSLDAYNPAENFVNFTDAAWVSDIQESVLPTTMRDGEVYGLPFWEASYSGLIYNQRIFEELDIELPKTQDEFNAVCDTLLENGVQPIYLPLKDAWPILYQYGMDPIFEDAELLEKLNTNQITYSEIPEMKAQMEWYKMAADQGYFGESFSTDTWDYCMEVLGEGEAAMMYCWDTWLYSDYDSEAYTYTADDFGLMPAFLATTENGTFEGPNCCLMLANKNSENAEAAIEFINFMADPENYNIAFEDFQTAPVFKQQTTIQATPQYQAAADWIAEVGHASIANPEIIGFSNVDGAKCIQELLIGNVDVDTCLQRMDEERIKAAKTQNAAGF
ncbi:MAG: extracellular solute-binding protein [Eubacteriales bacterium]|nr:extracellular solute-binding protein [Eubacteriales bacterium]